MTPDWKALTPHRPLEPGDARYIDPPHTTAARIAAWILAGGSTVLLGGPVGGGKSTELARVATLLRDERLVALVSLGRMGNVRAMTADEVYHQINQRVVKMVVSEWHIQLSAELRSTLHARGLVDVFFTQPGVAAQPTSPMELLNLTLREVSRSPHQKRACLLIDGLEVVEESEGRGAFRALSQLEEQVDVVVVVPWHITFDPGRGVAVRDGEKLFALRMPRTAGASGENGRLFLRKILAGRLGLDDDIYIGKDFHEILGSAAALSGGIPRIFLQILADAATLARLRRKEDWPIDEDVRGAVADQLDSVRRSLLPGDRKAIRSTVGTDGTELDRAVKIRLLTAGTLLERDDEQLGTVLEAHPLVEPLLAAATP